MTMRPRDSIRPAVIRLECTSQEPLGIGTDDTGKLPRRLGASPARACVARRGHQPEQDAGVGIAPGARRDHLERRPGRGGWHDARNAKRVFAARVCAGRSSCVGGPRQSLAHLRQAPGRRLHARSTAAHAGAVARAAVSETGPCRAASGRGGLSRTSSIQNNDFCSSGDFGVVSVGGVHHAADCERKAS